MLFIKQEYMHEIESAKDFDEAILIIQKMLKENKAVSMGLTFGKTNIYMRYMKEMMDNGYKPLHFDMARI